MRNAATAILATVLAAAAARSGEPVGVVPLRKAGFSAKPSATTDGGKVRISFTLAAASDVEVAVLDGKGDVVRHLAAGVLGAEHPPPAPLKPGLAQSLEWDGLDDYGEKPGSGPFKVRIRTGMGARIERIVGGDPYAFYSQQSGQGDHFQWKMAGIEAKPGGMVYVMGNTTFYGSQVIREYDAAGTYLKTVFPPAADKPVEDVKGWGVNVRNDGTFTLKNNADGWKGTGLGTTGISTSRYGKIVANFVAWPGSDSLALQVDNSFFLAGTDGKLKECTRQPLYGDAKLPPKGLLRGPGYTALSPDGKHLYISGVHSFSRSRGYGRVEGVNNDDFWRDGQVWRLELASKKLNSFFALDKKSLPEEMKARQSSPIGDHDYINPCTALHGVAVDRDGRVFVCDRLNQRVVVLDGAGKVLAELPVKYPDAIGVSPRSKAVYVTTRYGDYGGAGKLALLKFNDWSKDRTPAVNLQLWDKVGKFAEHSMMAVAERDGQVLVWVVYTTLPVRIYKDAGAGLELFKDFYESGLKQRALDLQHMQVDRTTGHVYIDDAAGFCWRITDWKDPQPEVCMLADGKTRVHGANVAIDQRNRHLYTQAFYGTPACRYSLEGDRLVPAPVAGGKTEVTAGIIFGWGFNGLRPKGMAVCPDGALVTLGNPRDSNHKGDDYGGYIYYWKRDENKAPWQSTYLGRQSSGGIRFDPRGNMYVSSVDGRFKDLAKDYARESSYFARIQKFTPTGSFKEGCLYPSAPENPARVYDVHLSPIGGDYKTPRFGVDEYGRIYSPSGIEARVGVVDNEGNRILDFGTYGNRDSMGGLKGDLVPTGDVPMAWPNSVDGTDDYIYVTDIINTRLLRLEKTFAATETVGIK